MINAGILAKYFSSVLLSQKVKGMGSGLGGGAVITGRVEIWLLTFENLLFSKKKGIPYDDSRSFNLHKVAADVTNLENTLKLKMLRPLQGTKFTSPENNSPPQDDGYSVVSMTRSAALGPISMNL